jgi:hypothetical protein
MATYDFNDRIANVIGYYAGVSMDEVARDVLSDTVTITISRNEAEWWAMHRPMPEQFGNFFERQIQKACREALEGER